MAVGATFSLLAMYMITVPSPASLHHSFNWKFHSKYLVKKSKEVEISIAIILNETQVHCWIHFVLYEKIRLIKLELKSTQRNNKKTNFLSFVTFKYPLVYIAILQSNKKSYKKRQNNNKKSVALHLPQKRHDQHQWLDGYQI